MKTATLDEVFEIARGASPRPIDEHITDDPSGVPWIMIGDASSTSKYISGTKKRIHSSSESLSRTVEPGDFLLTNSMSFGHPYISRIRGCIHDGWLLLRPRTGEIDPEYFYYVLGSDSVKTQFARLASGTTVKNLNSDLVRGVRVGIPPLPEQRRIADILDRADALKRKRQQALQLADKFIGSIFDHHFGDPLKCSGHTTLGSLIDPDRPLTYGILMPGPDVPDGVPYIRVAEMKDGTVDLSDVKRTTRKIHLEYKRSILAQGDILISIRGHVGRVVVIPAELDGANITQDTARIALKDPTYREFVVGALLSAETQRWMQKRVRGAAVKGLNLGDLRQLPIPVPSDESIRAYSQAVGAIRAVRHSLTSAVVETQSLSASLVDGLLRKGGA